MRRPARPRSRAPSRGAVVLLQHLPAVPLPAHAAPRGGGRRAARDGRRADRPPLGTGGLPPAGRRPGRLRLRRQCVSHADPDGGRDLDAGPRLPRRRRRRGGERRTHRDDPHRRGEVVVRVRRETEGLYRPRPLHAEGGGGRREGPLERGVLRVRRAGGPAPDADRSARRRLRRGLGRPRARRGAEARRDAGRPDEPLRQPFASSAATAAAIRFPSSASRRPAGQSMPRPRPASGFGMTWKWTCGTAWWAATPLFWRTL